MIILISLHEIHQEGVKRKQCRNANGLVEDTCEPSIKSLAGVTKTEQKFQQ